MLRTRLTLLAALAALAVPLLGTAPTQAAPPVAQAPTHPTGTLPTNGLLGWWPAEGNALDSSPNGNNGTLVGGVTYAPGSVGQAFSFPSSGNTYVTAGTSSTLNPGTGLTLMAWIYPTTQTPEEEIINKDFEYQVSYNNGIIQYAIANASPGYTWISSGCVAPLNQWTHMALTYNGSNVITYINGAACGNQAASGAIAPTSNELRIGGRTIAFAPFRGLLDESAVYNRALTAAEVQQAYGGPENVTWIHKGYTSASGSTLTKTGTNVAWDGGAISNRAIQSGAGYVEARVNRTSGDIVLGLGSGDSNQGYPDVDYGFWVESGRAYILEGGTYRGAVGPVTAASVLRVSVASGTVSYAINGVTVYTSGTPASYPLVFDTSLVYTGDALVNAQISGTDLVTLPDWPAIPAVPTEAAVWTNPVNVSVSGNSITKTSPANAWDAGASSTRAIQSGDGYAQVTAGSVTGDIMLGLSNGDSSAGYWDIDYAFWTESNWLYVVEGGAYKAAVGRVYAGDILTVVVQSGTVSYFRNGALLYTSSTPAVYPLGLDTSIVYTGDSVTNAMLGGNAIAGANGAAGVTTGATQGWPVRPAAALALTVEKSRVAFADVPANASYSAAVAWAANRGLVAGGQLQPSGTLTRGELAQWITQASGRGANSAVLTAAPNAPVTREALLRAVLTAGRPPQSGAYTGQADVPATSGLAPYVAEGQTLGWAPAQAHGAKSVFGANRAVTRAEALDLLYRVFGAR